MTKTKTKHDGFVIYDPDGRECEFVETSKDGRARDKVYEGLTMLVNVEGGFSFEDTRDDEPAQEEERGPECSCCGRTEREARSALRQTDRGLLCGDTFCMMNATVIGESS